MSNYDHIFDLLKLKKKKGLKCEFTEKCILELPRICNNCLHEILKDKFSSWGSGNELIDRFIRKTQLLSSYERYPEWVPYSSLSQVKQIGEGGFGTVFSAIWNWGIKTTNLSKHHRTGPCKVALKKLKGEMKITEAFLSEVQAQFDFCHLYGITQDPSSLDYMFVMRFAPQGDLRRYLLQNFDKISLASKLGIAQTICAELEKIHAKGWVHGDLHCGNILLLNEENAFISDFGLCRPVDEVESKETLYGVIPNIAPEIIRGHPRSQAGDIYGLGIILWELVCGVVAFADRSHDVRLIVDIFDGLRPQTCHFAPPVYNDLLERCWNRDPSKRPSIKEILKSIELWCFHRKQNDVMNNNSIEGHKLFRSHYMSKGGLCVKNKFCSETIHDENDRFGNEFDDTIRDQFVNSQNAGYIYILMKWRPNKPIHLEAVYTSRSFSYKSLQEEINIFLSQRKSNRKSNQSSIVIA